MFLFCSAFHQAPLILNASLGEGEGGGHTGSLHTIVSLVEWSSLKGRILLWFTVRKTTCFTKMPLVTISGHMISLMLLLSLFSVLFSTALLLLSLHVYSTFYGLFFGFFKFLPISFSWLWCSFSKALFSPDCCFFWPFLWPLLPTISLWLVFSTL